MHNNLTKFISILVFTCVALTVFAQKIYYVGIPNAKFNYIASSQIKPQWCWAASIQMVLNYYNISIKQEQIVERTYGCSLDGELPNWAASIETIHLNLNNWSVDNTGKKYIVNAQFGLGAPEPYFLIEELRQKRPILIGYQSNTGYHTVVITAISYFDSDFGPVIRSITIRDPLPDQNIESSCGRVEYDAVTLVRRITAYWFIRVFIADL